MAKLYGICGTVIHLRRGRPGLSCSVSVEKHPRFLSSVSSTG
jgi:hypothetical protein